jgi:hypothetical protein
MESAGNPCEEKEGWENWFKKRGLKFADHVGHGRADRGLKSGVNF